MVMDRLTYSYKPGTNQLDKVVDAATDAAIADYDKYNDLKQGQQNGNYHYDAIGNLISDVSEGITDIDWTVYGKIKQIRKRGGILINYRYDAAGNRIFKREGVGGKEIWYVRDASGNVMSVYTKDPSQNSGHLTQSEIHLYGSNRLGIFNTNTDMEMPPVEGNVITFTKGNKFFELSNHLGNVLTTVSDKKFGIDTNGDGIIDYYTADVVSANDYYPFGMMPGRKFANGHEYRYSINGQEKTPEVAPNTTTACSWQYDSRTASRWNVDPVKKLFKSSYAGNNPALLSDVNGAHKTCQLLMEETLPYRLVLFLKHSKQIGNTHMLLMGRKLV